jgi:carbon monoxide dehydrogenase subunit G
MEVCQSVTIDRPVAVVWRVLEDVTLVAQCLPGAKLTEDLGGDRYKGTVAIKLGPVLANFACEIQVERDAPNFVGKVIGKGSDSRTASRAQAETTYHLVSTNGGADTQIDIVSNIMLSGMLAQFGKGAVITEIATRLTQAFAANLREHVIRDGSAAAPTAPPVMQAEPIKAQQLLFSILWARLAALGKRFTSLFARSRG